MIKKITVRNFKSLLDVTVNLDPVTVIIGRSGTGKSNLINAIRRLRRILTEQNQPYAVLFPDWSSMVNVTLQNGALSYELDFSVEGIEGDFRYTLSFLGPPNWSVISEELRLKEKIFFSSANGKWKVSPPSNPNLPPSQIALGRVYGITEVRVAHLALTQGIGCYDFPSTVMQVANQSQNASLNEDGSNYLSTLYALNNDLAQLGAFKEILSGLQELDPTISAVDVVSVPAGVLITHRGAGGKLFPFTLFNESEGIRRVFAHLLALYQTPKKPTLFFEEPEKGLYPGALAVLAAFFKNGPSQVILTTHSPTLLDQVPVENIRVADIENCVTRIGPVAHEQLEAVKQHLLTTGELLSADPARIATETPVATH